MPRAISLLTLSAIASLFSLSGGALGFTAHSPVAHARTHSKGDGPRKHTSPFSPTTTHSLDGARLRPSGFNRAAVSMNSSPTKKHEAGEEDEKFPDMPLGLLTQKYKELEQQREQTIEEQRSPSLMRRLGFSKKAEVINGRLAMLAFALVLTNEFTVGTSIPSMLGNALTSLHIAMF